MKGNRVWASTRTKHPFISPILGKRYVNVIYHRTVNLNYHKLKVDFVCSFGTPKQLRFLLPVLIALTIFGPDFFCFVRPGGGRRREPLL